mmetsp:Transcript_46030/g.130150  ORF Transcript_46030/g.130150 Transcript_46030/m.130150 type:complete len:216 (-) Transcript_46030:303-950(-)
MEMALSFLNRDFAPKAPTRVCARSVPSESVCRARRRTLICEGSAAANEDTAWSSDLLSLTEFITSCTRVADGTPLANVAEASVGHASRSQASSVKFSMGSPRICSATLPRADMSRPRAEVKSSDSAFMPVASARPPASSWVSAALSLLPTEMTAQVCSARVLTGGFHARPKSGSTLSSANVQFAMCGHLQDSVLSQGSDSGPWFVPLLNSHTSPT